MPRRAGEHHVVGYGENSDNPTIDIISAEINFIGDLVGPSDDPCGLMVLAARGRRTSAHRHVPSRPFPGRPGRSRERPDPRPGDPHPVTPPRTTKEATP